MAEVRRYRGLLAAALLALAALALAPARADDQAPKTDLYDRPVLAIDPGMHTAVIRSQAIDAAGRFAVTGGDDRTVRVWSLADGKLLRTIWMPVGPQSVGAVYAVTISPDGSTIAAGGYTERLTGGPWPIYLFDRESGNLIRRIGGDLPQVTYFLTFSPDGRYLAATLGGPNGLRVFDRDRDWSEAFHDTRYGDTSYHAAFSRDDRLVTTSYDGLIRAYEYKSDMKIGGLGIQVTEDAGLIKVVAAKDDSPAAKAGVLPGDVITAIDDVPTQGLTLDQAVAKIHGAISSPVNLRIVRGALREVKEFSIVRDLIGVQSVFRRIGDPVGAPSGHWPRGVTFSPDDKLLALGYYDVAAVDVLDATTLKQISGRSPNGIRPAPFGLPNVVWSGDGQTLFADGGIFDTKNRDLVFAWDHRALGDERRMTYCTTDSTAGLNVLPDGRILVAASGSCLGVMDARGKPLWTAASPTLDLRNQADDMRVSRDGQIVDFHHGGASGPFLRFDARTLALSKPPPSDGLTFAPNREGPKVDGWRNGAAPTLDGRALPFVTYDVARSLAVDPNSKRFFLGSSYALAAFEGAGAPKWRWQSRNEVLAVNASGDGRVVVSADSDGAIRWHRADDGHELLALQVLRNDKPPAEWDWVLWTPEGFYEATPGAENALRWVVNHGPEAAATTLPVSAIAKLHRPAALSHVLDQLETAHALGVDDISQARLDVQKATGSAKPPGGMLHVLSIGIDNFGDKAGGLHLNYAAEDARDIATAILESQKGGPGKASLYADVELSTLTNDKADGAAILDALDAMAESVAKNGSEQDVAVILISSHGEMIDGQFYLIPHGFDASSKGRSVTSAVSASQFGERIGKIAAAHGKVLILLDACYSGAIGAQGWARDPDAKILEDALDIDNVTVLTSSKRTEKSEELPEWKHGAFAQAFLGALVGAADPQGIVTVSTLEDAMENEVAKLTNGRQHVGTHRNFSGDLFFASHN